MKKFSPILLVLITILALSTMDFAAGSGSITVENATIDHNYAGYKIFDATYAEGAVSYTIKSTDPWYSLVSRVDSPFTLTQVGSTTTHNVGVKEDKTDSDIITWLKGQSLPGTPDLENVPASSTTVMWDGVSYGYYLITSDLGTLVTVTNVDSAVIIRDKNKIPGWEDPTPEDPDDGTEQGKNVSSNGINWGPTNTSSIGDEVYFKINAFIPKYDGERQVKEYIFIDTLDDGFTYNNDLAVKINGATQDAPADYSVVVNGQVITITIPIKDSYPTESSVEINYTATVDKDAVYDNENSVDMDWTLVDPEDPDGSGDPNDPDDVPPTTETHTYVYGFNLQKYKETVAEGNKLTGAEFKLYDALSGGNEIPVVWDATLGGYRVAVAGETGAAIEAGTAKIFGLAEGTYYLEETQAPDGYNPLTARQAVVISAASSTNGYLTNEVAVVNLTGTVLPETGGIGTTIFYVIGGLLMGGALILMVTRKIMSAGRN